MSNTDQAPVPSAQAAPENAAVQVEDSPPARGMNPKRKRALLILSTVVVLGGVAWGLYDWLVLSHFEDTDNAYVRATSSRSRRRSAAR